MSTGRLGKPHPDPPPHDPREAPPGKHNKQTPNGTLKSPEGSEGSGDSRPTTQVATDGPVIERRDRKGPIKSTKDGGGADEGGIFCAKYA